MMGNFVSRFTPKLTEEAGIYAVNRLACNAKPKDIVVEIQEQFGMTVTAQRIQTMIQGKRWGELYAVAHEEYLIKMKDFTGIALAAQRTRLQDGEKMRASLAKIIARMELRLDQADSDPKKATVAHESRLITDLQGLFETYLKVLKYGQQETAKVVQTSDTQPGFNKFMAQININTNQSEKPATSELPQIVDVKEEEHEG